MLKRVLFKFNIDFSANQLWKQLWAKIILLSPPKDEIIFSNFLQQVMNSKFNKLIGSPEARLKYKKQCLKNKNILFENDSIQIGCKIIPFYDFFTSKNYLQMQMFIGNKTNKKLQRFNIQYKGTSNLQLYVQEKNKQIAQNAQFKERIIVGCLDYEKQILLLVDFQSQVLTLQSIPVPLTLYSFCIITPQNMNTLPLTSSYSQLSDLLSSRFQYIQQQEITVNVGIFKKGLIKDINKFFPNLTIHTQNMLVGHFTLEDLTHQYVLALLVKDQLKIKVALASNQYLHYESILQNLKFLLGG